MPRGWFSGPGVGVLDTRYLRLDASNDPVIAGLEINGGTIDDPLVILDSLSDDDAAFIDFRGVVAVNLTKSITTHPGPWMHAGSIKIQINGADYWIFYNSG